jgi:S-adenosylmethionine synthetase
MVETFGTEKISRAEIARLVGEHFDLRPGAFREELRLHRPIFQKTAAYGHFGREDHDFTWEKTDRASALRAAAGLSNSDDSLSESSGESAGVAAGTSASTGTSSLAQTD